MSWYLVEIRSSDVAELSAKALMCKFAQAYRATGIPVGVRVYHGNPPAGDHIYYFSPEAAAIGSKLLQDFHASALPSEPDLTGFKLVDL